MLIRFVCLWVLLIEIISFKIPRVIVGSLSLSGAKRSRLVFKSFLFLSHFFVVVGR